MKIGECLRDARIKLGLSITDVSVDVHISSDKLSRIERGATEPTLSLTRAICTALNVNLFKLLKDMEVEADSISELISLNSSDTVLTADLAQRLLRYFGADIPSGVELLAGLWRMIESDFSVGSVLPIPNNSVDALVTHFVRSYQSFSVDVKSPPELNASQVLEIHKAGGILTFPEIGLYNRFLRQVHKSTMAEFAKKGGRSLQLISKLESGQIDDVRFKDLIMLDDAYQQHGTIIQMYWNAMAYSNTMRFYFRTDGMLGHTVDYSRALYLFVTLCRWLQFKFGDDHKWLTQLTKWCDSADLRWDQRQGFIAEYLEQYELTSVQWERIKAFLLHSDEVNLVDSDYRVLGGILFKLISGWAWERLPEKYYPFKGCREQYYEWCRQGKWPTIWGAYRIYQTPAQQDRLMSNFLNGDIIPIDSAIFDAYSHYHLG